MEQATATRIIVDQYGLGAGRVGPGDHLFIRVDDLSKGGRLTVDYHVEGLVHGTLSLELDGRNIGLAVPLQREGSISADFTVRDYGNASLFLKHNEVPIYHRNVMFVEASLHDKLMAGIPQLPGLLLATIVEVGDRTSEGQLIAKVADPWFDIVEYFRRDPEAIYKFDDRKWEELVAGAWKRAGATEVVLTPRSGDLGRDVIAVFDQLGTVRLIDQVKRYGPGQRVDANDVRALYGVLAKDPGASKGFVTTTSEFAPGIYEEFKNEMPGRLTLRDKSNLLTWLESLIVPGR